MDDDFPLQILNRLLGKSGRRATRAIERQLGANEVASAAYKSCADALAAHASSVSQPVNVSNGARDRILSEILRHVAREPRRARRWLFKTWGWPAAAAILLGLNLAQWRWTSARTGDGGSKVPGPAPEVAGDSMSDRPGGPADGSIEKSAAKPATLPALDRDTENRLRALRKEYAALTARSRLDDRNRERLVQQMLGAMTSATDGRLSAIMLVDRATYNAKRTASAADADPSLAALSSPGIVAATAPLATPPLNAPTSIATIDASPVITAATAPSGLSLGTPPLPTAPNGQSTPSSTVSASAYSIFDPTLGQGFLDMYNMPTPPPGSALELWVQPQGATVFVPVGQIPEAYYGTSGGIYYKLPVENAVPEKILVTIESNPTAGAPATPSANTVVQGP